MSDHEGNQESSSDDHSANESIVGECRLKQRKISVELWDGVDKEVVEHLPRSFFSPDRKEKMVTKGHSEREG